AAITSFDAGCTSSNGGAPGLASGTTAPVIVVGLTNGALYSCVVSARNAVGAGTASSASPAFVAGSPGTPQIVTIRPGTTSRATGGLQISCSAAADNGSAVTTYSATCRPVTTGVTRSGSATQSPVFVGGLATGKAYSCTVFATNAWGNSF